jgi:hypothetical protein
MTRVSALVRFAPPIPIRAAVMVMMIAATTGGRQAAAQGRRAAPATHEVFAGGEFEAYLRALQVEGVAGLVPWSVRPFGPREIERLAVEDSVHPWGGRHRLRPPRRGAPHIYLIQPRGRAVFNSAFPYGSNDGPVWAGRGLTYEVQGGFAAGLGPISLTIAPIAFRAENAAFELSGSQFSYRDRRSPSGIDLPQRFGAGPYARVDAGESTARIDLLGLAAGISTAGQVWGPARELPLLLGVNAGGFPHAFVGTSGPADLWIGRLQVRLIGGRLDQSAFSPVMLDDPRRFVSGIVGAFTPRGADGLELGLGRFYHTLWPEGGPEADDWLRPLEGFLKQGLLDGDNPDARQENQLVSVFGRWVLPRSGFEIHGEFVREDHSYDLRHFLLEPSDLSGYSVGFGKTWRHGSRGLTVLRGETMNSENARRGRQLDGGGRLSPLYTHSRVRQGHTQRGQLLVPAAAYGGSAQVLGLDRYHERGRWTIEWRREQRESRALDQQQAGSRSAVDVVHALGVGGLWFAGNFDVTVDLTAAYNFDRNFERDVLGAGLALGVRMLW